VPIKPPQRSATAAVKTLLAEGGGVPTG